MDTPGQAAWQRGYAAGRRRGPDRVDRVCSGTDCFNQAVAQVSVRRSTGRKKDRGSPSHFGHSGLYQCRQISFAELHDRCEGAFRRQTLCDSGSNKQEGKVAKWTHSRADRYRGLFENFLTAWWMHSRPPWRKLWSRICFFISWIFPTRFAEQMETTIEVLEELGGADKES